MRREPILALLAAFVMAACSAEPAREQASGAPAPAQDAAEAQQGGVSPGAVTTADPDAPVSDAGVPDGDAATAEAPPARGPASGGGVSGSAAPSGGTAAPAAPAAPATQAPAPSAAPSEAADEGADVLRRAAAAYANVRSLRADFVMNFENPLLRQTTTSRGTIYQQQPDRIALRFSEPDGDVILSDGRNFWVYYPSVNAQQVIRSPAAAGGESGVNLQAQFVGNPVERFRYELHGTEQVAGRAAHALTLVPRQRAEYRSLRVWLDTRDGLARRFEITEHNGSVRRFDLQNMQVNPTIPESVFRFTPPEGARIVDAG